MRKPKQRKPNDLSRSLAALDADHTLIAVVEMSLSSRPAGLYRTRCRAPAAQETEGE